MSKKNEKRNRLIDAANDLIYQQTFNSTTLADIAAKSEVPLGNVYYYFKTKDEILMAVVQKRENELNNLFEVWDQLPDVKDRLRSFIAQHAQGSDTIARFGCALGSLCQELGKHGGDLAELTGALMRKTIHWVEKQFQALGKGDRALNLAEQLIANLQGVSLLALTFHDPDFLYRQSKMLEQSIESA